MSRQSQISFFAFYHHHHHHHLLLPYCLIASSPHGLYHCLYQSANNPAYLGRTVTNYPALHQPIPYTLHYIPRRINTHNLLRQVPRLDTYSLTYKHIYTFISLSHPSCSCLLLSLLSYPAFHLRSRFARGNYSSCCHRCHCVLSLEEYALLATFVVYVLVPPSPPSSAFSWSREPWSVNHPKPVRPA